MDILGVVLAIVGLVTLLSLFSATKSSLTGSWINILAQVFGWGDYILPVGLLILGVWLVARNVDRLPALNIERVTGMLLLFIGLLVAFHGLDGPTATAIERARAGQRRRLHRCPAPEGTGRRHRRSRDGHRGGRLAADRPGNDPRPFDAGYVQMGRTHWVRNSTPG